MSTLRASASYLALGVSLWGTFAGTSAMALEGTDVELHHTNLVTDQADTELAQLTNKRFSDHPELLRLQPGDLMEKGEEGEHIEALQNALLDSGFAIEAGATGGLYNQTLGALNNFRASVDLEPSQSLDYETLMKLDELAPPPGKTLSEHPTSAFPEAQFVNGKPVRVLVNIKEHRLFLYSAEGEPQAVYPVATGKASKPTDPGLKVVNYKYDDPSPVAWQLWPESQGKAFGTKMIDLRWYDAETGETRSSDEEIHGTFNRNSIGTDASSGCVRMHNESVEAIYPLLQKGDLIRFQ